MAKITITIQDNPDGSLYMEARSDRPTPEKTEEQTEAEVLATKIAQFIISLGDKNPTIQ